MSSANLAAADCKAGDFTKVLDCSGRDYGPKSVRLSGPRSPGAGSSMVELGERPPSIGQQGQARPQPKHAAPQQQQQAHAAERPASSKHIMCRQIEAAGKCSWGDRCWFAHDAAEQEQGRRQRQPGFKGSTQNTREAKRQSDIMNWPSEREKLFSSQEQAIFGRRPQNAQKHQLCPYLPDGRCTHGDSCQYSHSFQEQQAAIGNIQAAAVTKNFMDAGSSAQPGPQKDQLCVKFGRGLCTRGDKCWFAHSLAEQRGAIKHRQEQGTTSKVDQEESSQGQLPFEQSRKHLPCQVLKAGKACTQGAKCPFAHGEHERRLAVEAMHQPAGSQPAASADATLLQHPDLDTVEAAAGQHSTGSSSPGTMGRHLDPEAGKGASSRKQTICMALQNGHCPAGDRCRFSHSQQERLHTMLRASTMPHSQEASGLQGKKLDLSTGCEDHTALSQGASHRAPQQSSVNGHTAPQDRHQTGKVMDIGSRDAGPPRPVHGNQAAAHQPSSLNSARPRRAAGSGMRAWPEPEQHGTDEAPQTPASGEGSTDSTYRWTETADNSFSEHHPAERTVRSRPSGLHQAPVKEQQGLSNRLENEAQRQQFNPHALPGPSKKHVPCLMFAKHGACPRGDRCWFAHGPEELQAASIQQLQSKQLQSRATKQDVDAKGKRLCIYHRSGKCGRGMECSFSHAPSAGSNLTTSVQHLEEPLDAWNTAIEDAVNSTAQGSNGQQGTATTPGPSSADEWTTVLDSLVRTAPTCVDRSQQQVVNQPGEEEEAWSKAIFDAVDTANVISPSMQGMPSSSVAEHGDDWNATIDDALVGAEDATSPDTNHAAPQSEQHHVSYQDGQQNALDMTFVDAPARTKNTIPAGVTDLSERQVQQPQTSLQHLKQDAWVAGIDDAALSAGAEVAANILPGAEQGAGLAAANGQVSCAAGDKPSKLSSLPQFGSLTGPVFADMAASSPTWHPDSQPHSQDLDEQTTQPSSRSAAQSQLCQGADLTSTTANEVTNGQPIEPSAAASTEALQGTDMSSRAELQIVTDQQHASDATQTAQLAAGATSNQDNHADKKSAATSGSPCLDGFDEDIPAEFQLPAEDDAASNSVLDVSASGNSVHLSDSARSSQQEASKKGHMQASTAIDAVSESAVKPTRQPQAASLREPTAADSATSALTESGAPAHATAALEAAPSLVSSSQPQFVKGTVLTDDLEALELDEEASRYAPALLRCPLTKEVFRNPVIAKDGRTFERSALLSWWTNHETFPYSNKTAYDRTLLPNAALRAAITALYGVIPMRPQPVGMR
ncbi:hypothetical protein WJX74_009111 [Apatococcus lobatus]|uniref:C3H1-type domain-containing protein n=1 Tax=Apatococcus lobatus TaxID=904363 RepID=A0AAW1R0R6_9CHLO